MTPEEQLFLVANIISAAHHLGIGLRETSAEGQYSFEWRDQFSNVTISGPTDPDRKKALELACTKLADSLSTK